MAGETSNMQFSSPINPYTFLGLGGLSSILQAAGTGISTYYNVKEGRRKDRIQSRTYQKSFDENQRQFNERMNEERKQNRNQSQQSALEMLAALDKMSSRAGHLALLKNIGV